jgi:Ca2+-transporting ATPase
MDGQRLNYYRLTPDEVLAELKSRPEGLTNKEARERLEHLGSNALDQVKHETALVTFIRQF